MPTSLARGRRSLRGSPGHRRTSLRATAGHDPGHLYGVTGAEQLAGAPNFFDGALTDAAKERLPADLRAFIKARELSRRSADEEYIDGHVASWPENYAMGRAPTTRCSAMKNCCHTTPTTSRSWRARTAARMGRRKLDGGSRLDRHADRRGNRRWHCPRGRRADRLLSRAYRPTGGVRQAAPSG